MGKPRPDVPEKPTLRHGWWPLPTQVWLGLTLALGLAVRLINLNAFGFNSDEAVYAGQSASIAGNPLFVNQFPVFRAHPLLMPTLLSPLFRSGTPDLRGRVVVALFGVATLFALYLVGKELYGPKTGILGALILALMPYHLVVTRQLLLDGPAVLWITLSFWMLARFVRTDRFEWLAASAATLGLGVLTKETSIVLAGSVVIFLLISTEVRRPGRAVTLSLGVLAAVSLVFPLAIKLAGRSSTGQSYLAWQLTRTSNHAGTFYLTVIPSAIGWLVVAAALSALIFRINRSWRELLLVLWIIVPFIILEIYPLKGYQYLLPIAPPVALLAARALTTWHLPARWNRYTKSIVRPVVIVVVLLSLLPGVWSVIFPSVNASALAGQGGVPGGREAGKWVGAESGAGHRAHDHRTEPGQHPRVLRSPSRPGPVGEHQPPSPQPGVHADLQPRQERAQRSVHLPGVGRLLGLPVPVDSPSPGRADQAVPRVPDPHGTG